VENLLSNSGILRELGRSPDATAELGIVLGKVISILANLLVPEVIFVGGDLEEALLSMLSNARQELGKRLLLKDSRNIQIQFAPNIHHLFFEGASELIIQTWLMN
jgi:hypothetical protein